MQVLVNGGLSLPRHQELPPLVGRQATPCPPGPQGTIANLAKEKQPKKKKNRRGGKKRDIKQVDDVGRQLGMGREKRRRFGKHLEDIKQEEGRGDFSYNELIEKARQFLGR